MCWGLSGFLLATVALLAAVLRSTASTAAIGVFFAPVYAAGVGLAWLAFGYGAPDLGACLRGRASRLSRRGRLRAAVSATLAIAGLAYVGHGTALTVTVERARHLDEDEIARFLDESGFRCNRFVLGAVVENPRVSSAVLHRIAGMEDPALHRAMGSVWPVMGDNGKGLAVMRLIARHPRVSEATLVALADSPDAYVRGAVAANPSTPPAILDELAGQPDYRIEWGLAANERAPVQSLRRLARDGDQYARSRVAGNPAAPVEILRELAQDPLWHVRRGVAGNARTPVDILEQLRDDPDHRVRQVADHRLTRRQNANR